MTGSQKIFGLINLTSISFFVSDIKDMKQDWRVLFSIFLCLTIHENLTDESCVEFVQKMTEKLEQEKACSEEFDRKHFLKEKVLFYKGFLRKFMSIMLI